AVDISNGITGNKITFAAPHGLSTGQVVTYQTLGGTAIGGLTNGRRYSVVVPVGTGVDSTRSIQLGTIFDASYVDPLTDEVVFAGHHSLQTGDSVYYFAPSGSTADTGLSSGTRYTVYRVDDFRIKLRTPGMATPSVTLASASSVSVNGAFEGVVTAANSFTDPNMPVTYHAPARMTFTSLAVNLEVTGTPGQLDLDSSHNLQYDSTNKWIFLGQGDPDADAIFATGHNFAMGDQVRYTASNPFGTTVALSPLSSGSNYFVRRLDAFRVQLATTYCNAVGTVGDPTNCPADTHGNSDPDDDTPQPIVVLTLSPDRSTPNGKATVHSLVKTNDLPLSGLVDGRAYFVVNRHAGDFQLATTPGGAPIFFSNGGRTGGPHTFAVEGLDLQGGGTGSQYLIFDMSSLGTGTQKLDGIGGSQTLAGAPSGDQISTASSSGSSGGAIDVRAANASSTVHPTVTNTIGGVIHAGTINITTDNRGMVGANTRSSGGGLVSIGDADAATSATTDTTITIDSGAQLIATGNVNINAGATLVSSVESEGSSGGFIAGAHSSATSTLNHSTATIVKGTITSGATATIGSSTSIRGTADADADAGGLGAGANATGRVNVGTTAYTKTEIWGSARVTAENIVVQAMAPSSYLHAETDASASAGGGDVNAISEVTLRSSTQVRVMTKTGGAGEQLVGNETIVLRSQYDGIDLKSDSDSACHCFAGDATARSDADIATQALIFGEDESFLKTADLLVTANQNVLHYDQPRDAHGGAFVDHHQPADGHNLLVRRIYWESTVLLLGEPNPVLIVDENRQITVITNNVYVKWFNPTTNTFSAGLLGLGDIFPAGTWIVVGDLIYDESGHVRFEANDHAPDSVIYGNAGLFQIKDTWDSVTITNRSGLRLVTNDIVVVSSAADPEIQIYIDNIPPSTGSPVNDAHLAESDTTFTTFEFSIKHVFAKTFVQILNVNPAIGTSANSDIYLDGDIENPIGHTYV